MLRYQTLVTAFCAVFILFSCSFSGSGKMRPSAEENTIQGADCPELKTFPAVFSTATQELKKELFAKGTKSLTKEDKSLWLNHEAVPTEVQNEDLQTYAINKISYEKATVVVYLLREPDDLSSHEQDQLILVIYNKEGKAMDVFSKNLEDPFSTREFQFTSNTAFNVVDTDSEYSPDPESEAEDIKNGYEPEVIISTTFYEIDPVKMKFRMLD